MRYFKFIKKMAGKQPAIFLISLQPLYLIINNISINIYNLKGIAQAMPLFYKINYLFLYASSIATATATVAPTMGLLPIPIRPIISTWAGTD